MDNKKGDYIFPQVILESEMGTASNHAGVGGRQFERQYSGQVNLLRLFYLV